MKLIKQIKTKSGNIICVEIPEDAYDIFIGYFSGGLCYRGGENKPIQNIIKLNNDENFFNKYKIRGKLSELTDKDCEEFVEFYEIPLRWVNYADKDFECNSAKESFISLLQSEGIDTNDENKLLIIKVL